MVLEDGSVLHSADEVHDGAVQLFSNLLSVSPISMGARDLDLLQSSITEEDNFHYVNHRCWKRYVKRFGLF